MAQTREHQGRLYIDNLEQLAADMLDYVMNPLNTREIIEIINEVYNKYKMPIESWIWGWIYTYSRNRTQDINGLIVTLCQTGNSGELLKSVTQFLASGGWTPTSANPALVKGIIIRLPGYQSGGEDNLLTPEIIKRLKDLFVAQQKQIKTASSVLHNARVERKDELKTLPKRSMKAAGSNMIADMIKTQEERVEEAKAKRSENGLIGRGNKLDKNKFFGVMSALEKIFKETTRMQFTPGKLDKARINNLNEKLGFMLASSAIKAEAEILNAQERHVQSVEVKFSEAAYVAKNVTLADQQEVRVREPGKLKLNSEQSAAIFRLFPSTRLKVKNEQDKTQSPVNMVNGA